MNLGMRSFFYLTLLKVYFVIIKYVFLKLIYKNVYLKKKVRTFFGSEYLPVNDVMLMHVKDDVENRQFEVMVVGSYFV